MEDCDTCLIEVYQDPKRNNRYFCKATAGHRDYVGVADLHFRPIQPLYEFLLNSSRISKARKKVKKKLKADGLHLKVLEKNSEVTILPKR